MKLHTTCHLCGHEFLAEYMVGHCEKCGERTHASVLTNEQREELRIRLSYTFLCMEDLEDSTCAMNRILHRISWYRENIGIYQACYLAVIDALLEEPTRTFAIEYFRCAYESSIKEFNTVDTGMIDIIDNCYSIMT